LLLRYTGHSRQHALRVMMVMPVMEVQQAHLYFRVAFELPEVNPSCIHRQISRNSQSRTYH
jgi:hypothetical protein